MTLQERIAALPWFHSIDFGHGLVTPGAKSLEILQAEADAYFPKPLDGQSVLDIGCWDGFNSFAAHRRSAARVLATDHFAWSPGCWGNRASFELARTYLAPQVEVRDIDLADLSPDTVGTFDVVLFAGVLYHLRHPFQTLEQVARLVDRTLVVETHLDALDIDRPAMIFYPGAELNGDPTNWWGPNAACVVAMLRDLGFQNIRHTPHPTYGTGRGIFHATR